jgi:hypothetical protein
MKAIRKGERKKLALRLSQHIIKVMALYDIEHKDLAYELGIHPTTFYGWLRADNCPKNRDLYDGVMASLSARLLGKKPTPPPQMPLTFDEPVSVSTNTSALDVQIGGDHYKNSKIQPIEYIEANDLTFLEGSIVKRITRHGKPTGKGAEDIRKVIHEAQLILEMRYGIE